MHPHPRLTSALAIGIYPTAFGVAAIAVAAAAGVGIFWTPGLVYTGGYSYGNVEGKSLLKK